MKGRAAAAVTLLCASALGSHALMLCDLPWQAKPGEDMVSRAERQFAEVRADLPAEGAVGYRADPPAVDDTATERYHLTQYVLAPLLVKRDDCWPQIIDAGRGVRVRTSEGP